MRQTTKKFKRYVAYFFFLFLALAAFRLFLLTGYDKKIFLSRGVSSDGLVPGPLCRVVRVVDGDTLRVRCESKEEKVRLLFINTPEKGNYGYRQATNALRNLVRTGTVRLSFERAPHERRDRYGRWLAYVFVDDLNVNLEMVRRGWTRYWTRYGKGSLQREFEQAEIEARESEAGLWKKQ